MVMTVLKISASLECIVISSVNWDYNLYSTADDEISHGRMTVSIHKG